jgi:uncharacterized protein (DUF433 family)
MDIMRTLRKEDFIVSDPDILGGTPVFKGTRVPVEILFDYLRHSSMDEFFKGYPHVSRLMVNGVLMLAARKVVQKSRKTTYESVA